MKIEILEDFKHDRDQYSKGETRVVDQDLGEYFCKVGWAKDSDGKVKTGDRNAMHGQRLEIHKSTLKSKSTDI